ncbi:MAG: hypothetical protein J7480_04975 [Microbacteriaceae bacterium]|nr:hypothetical protein [Microbacteriaceae bacterium]
MELFTIGSTVITLEGAIWLAFGGLALLGAIGAVMAIVETVRAGGKRY